MKKVKKYEYINNNNVIRKEFNKMSEQIPVLREDIKKIHYNYTFKNPKDLLLQEDQLHQQQQTLNVNIYYILLEKKR